MNTLQNEVVSTRQQLLVHSTSAFGIATIILAIVLLYTFPITADLANGFHTPIIAFEFAKSEADLSFLSGNSELSVLNRNAMDNSHFWDMGFPFAYGGFITLALLQLANQVHRILLVGTAVAILIIPFDIQENLILLDITEALSQSADTTTLLSALAGATWLKWGGSGGQRFHLGNWVWANKTLCYRSFKLLNGNKRCNLLDIQGRAYSCRGNVSGNTVLVLN